MHEVDTRARFSVSVATKGSCLPRKLHPRLAGAVTSGEPWDLVLTIAHIIFLLVILCF